MVIKMIPDRMDVDDHHLIQLLHKSFDIKKIDLSMLEVRNPLAASIDDITELIGNLKDRQKLLQKQEDEFNQNAAMVPESDPNISRINE